MGPARRTASKGAYHSSIELKAERDLPSTRVPGVCALTRPGMRATSPRSSAAAGGCPLPIRVMRSSTVRTRAVGPLGLNPAAGDRRTIDRRAPRTGAVRSACSSRLRPRARGALSQARARSDGLPRSCGIVPRRSTDLARSCPSARRRRARASAARRARGRSGRRALRSACCGASATNPAFSMLRTISNSSMQYSAPAARTTFSSIITLPMSLAP